LKQSQWGLSRRFAPHGDTTSRPPFFSSPALRHSHSPALLAVVSLESTECIVEFHLIKNPLHTIIISMNKRIIMLLIAGVVIASVLLWWGFSSRTEEKSVVLITIDTIRADHVGVYGSSLHATLNLDAVAQSGVVFRNTFTPVPITLPSHVSILTGLYPTRHGVHTNGVYKLNPRITTIAEQFRKQGYLTGAVVASYTLNSRFGVQEGFDIFVDQMSVASKMPSETAQIIAEEVTKRSLKVLEGFGEKKYFLWIHYFDPHSPYTPPMKYLQKFSDPYTGEIAYTDEQIQVFLDALSSTSSGKNALVVIIGDHGESFGEHEENGHGYFLYNTTLKIPFIMQFPGKKYAGLSFNQEVLTLDIFPTLCDYFQFDCTGLGLQGTSLLPLISGNDKKQPHEFLYAESLLSQNDFGWAPLFAYLKDGWKYIQEVRPELYNYTADPVENHDEYERNRSKADRFATSLTVWKTKEKSKEIESSLKMDSESLEKLQALGYIAGSPQKTQPISLVDAKDMKTTIRILDQSTALLGGGKVQEAIGIVEGEIVRLEGLGTPAPYLYAIAAQFHASIADLDKALDYYKKYLAVNPNNATAYLAVARIYGDMKHDYPKAIEYLRTAIALDNKIVEAYSMLGDYLIELRRNKETEQVLKEGLRLFPDDYNILNTYAAFLILTKRNGEAITYLEHARDKVPELPDAYIYLAVIYLRKGEQSKALELTEKALYISPGNPAALRIKEKIQSERWGGTSSP